MGTLIAATYEITRPTDFTATAEILIDSTHSNFDFDREAVKLSSNTLSLKKRIDVGLPPGVTATVAADDILSQPSMQGPQPDEYSNIAPATKTIGNTMSSSIICPQYARRTRIRCALSLI